MPKKFDPWSVLVCYGTNKDEDDQAALRNLVAELEENRLWVKDARVVKDRTYYRAYYYRKRNLVTKQKRQIAKRIHE